MKPQRIQLSRKKGWRMPPNSVKVDRTTKYGNPFVVGKDGSAVQCVYWYCLLLCGYMTITRGSIQRQEAALKVFQELLIAKRGGDLRGKNLACWCRIGEPCHADALLIAASRPRNYRGGFDLDGFLARYGFRMVNGRPYRIRKAT